ncbi:MAG: protein kinase [Gemmataceae bacterium]
MRRCPPERELLDFADGWLTDAEMDRIGRHLDDCAACRAVLDRTAFAYRIAASPATEFAHEAGLRASERLTTLLSAEVAATTLYTGEAASSQEPAIERLGEFRLVRRLGAGGMGIVFEAEDESLRRRVAVKLMKPHLAVEDRARRRFLREARSAAGLKHESIVAIHHVGEDAGTPYLVMEFLEGESLGSRLQGGGRLPVPDVIRIGTALADALAAAHGHGVIHRDVKPDNIWLTSEQPFGVKLLDFGLARQLRDDQEITVDGAVIGTPAYMAPEQARGQTVDVRSDIFSLGCVLYRCLTGGPPFAGVDSLSTLTALAITTPTPPHRIDAAVPKPLSRLVLQMLAKDAADRPTAADVARAMRSVPDATPRRRVLAIAAAIILAGAAALGAWAMKRPAPAPEQTPGETANYALQLVRDSRIEIPGISFGGMDLHTIEFTVVAEPAEYRTSTHLIGVPRQCSVFINPGNRTWGFGTRVGSNLFTLSTPAPKPGIRTHIAAVRTAYNQRIYFDGKLMAETGCSRGNTDESASAFSIGPGFAGRIDEIRISKSVRYDQDFTLSPRLEADADTLALYHCDEDAGTTLVDASPHRRDGRITNVRRVPADAP